MLNPQKMKRLTLAFTIVILAIASLTAQTYTVTSPKIPDSLKIEKRLVDISEDGINRIERKFLSRIRTEYLTVDSVLCEPSSLVYLQSLWNKHYLYESSFQTATDSFMVEKIGNNYYFGGDITTVALNVERTALIQFKAYYIAKYGAENILRYLMPEFEKKRTRLDQLNDWYNQIQSQ